MPKQIRLLDMKTGRLEGDHWPQLRGYGYLLLQKHQDADSVYAAVILVRQQIVDAQVWTRDELENWFKQLVRRLWERHLYAPGRHCGHCPRGLTCPAKTALLTQSVKALGVDRLAGWTPAQRGDLYDAAKMVAQQAEAAMELLRAETEANGGTLAIGDGRELRLTEQKRRTIDPEAGLPVLRKMLNETQIYAAMKIAKGACEDAVKASAGRGLGAAAARDLNQRLEAAGALNVTTYQKLEVKRIGAAQPALTH